MQKAGILSKTETPTADEASDALDTLNDVLALLSNEELMTYVKLVESFTMTAGQSEYTVGTGGNFNTTRPISISSAYIRSGVTDYDIDNIGEDNFDAIPDKTTRGMPFALTYNGNSPLGKLEFYPVPDSGYTVYLRMQKPQATLTLDTVLELPPGWNMYIVHQLAVLLAPEYGVSCPPEVEAIAARSKEIIEITVAKNRTMNFPDNGWETDILRGYR
jgi:hypothetical protein